MESTNNRNELRIVGAYIVPNFRPKDGSRPVKSWRNFTGEPTPLNPAGGKGFFTVDLNRSGRIDYGNWRDGYVEKTVEELIAEGWHIRIKDAPEQYQDRIPNANFKVYVSFHNNPLEQWKDPRIKQHNADGTELELDQSIVGGLDSAWIENACVKVTRSKDGGNYLKVLEVFLKEASYNNPYSWD